MSAADPSGPAARAAAPIVLLHGWAMTPAAWAPLRAALTPTPSFAPALPGHAGRPAAAGSGVEAWADELVPALPEAAVLVGWSLGALVALALARRHPARVSRLVLIAGTARFVAAEASADEPTEESWPGLAADTVATFRSSFQTSPQAILRRFLALQCLGEADRRGTQEALADALDRPERPAVLAAGLDLLARTDLRRELAHIMQPCLLLHGEHDALMPLGAAQRLARALPNARLQVLGGSGHALPLSRSIDCARAILEFADA